jgi:hypothetical protein
VKIFYSTALFNGLQGGGFDLFCLEMIGIDRTTITISLQCGRQTTNRSIDVLAIAFDVIVPQRTVHIAALSVAMISESAIALSRAKEHLLAWITQEL